MVDNIIISDSTGVIRTLINQESYKLLAGFLNAYYIPAYLVILLDIYMYYSAIPHIIQL